MDACLILSIIFISVERSLRFHDLCISHHFVITHLIDFCIWAQLVIHQAVSSRLMLCQRRARLSCSEFLTALGRTNEFVFALAASLLLLLFLQFFISFFLLLLTLVLEQLWWLLNLHIINLVIHHIVIDGFLFLVFFLFLSHSVQFIKSLLVHCNRLGRFSLHLYVGNLNVLLNCLVGLVIDFWVISHWGVLNLIVRLVRHNKLKF
jgi:hypothetical protein